jgi:hypothetical protein
MFISGEQPYFFGSPHGGDDPQNAFGGYSSQFYEIVSALQRGEVVDLTVFETFFRELRDYLLLEADPNKQLYITIDWIWTFLDRLNEIPPEAIDRVQPIFGMIERNAFVSLFRAELVRGEHRLLHDQRWAGATWNSDNGLFGPLSRKIAICERLSAALKAKLLAVR